MEQNSRPTIQSANTTSIDTEQSTGAVVSPTPGVVDPANLPVLRTAVDPLHPLDQGGCYICKNNEKQELILLCDGCEGEFHTFCIDPPLPKVPQGPWFCPSCKATGKDVPKSRCNGYLTDVLAMET